MDQLRFVAGPLALLLPLLSYAPKIEMVFVRHHWRGGLKSLFFSSLAGDRARDDDGRGARVRDPADDHGKTAL